MDYIYFVHFIVIANVYLIVRVKSQESINGTIAFIFYEICNFFDFFLFLYWFINVIVVFHIVEWAVCLFFFSQCFIITFKRTF